MGQLGHFSCHRIVVHARAESGLQSMPIVCFALMAVHDRFSAKA